MYQQRVLEDSTLAEWDAQQMWDGVTGATLQSKFLKRESPPRQIWLGDSLLALTDDFGQCWFELQCGTYPITATLEGYCDTTQTVHVRPDEPTDMILFLDRAPSFFADL